MIDYTQGDKIGAGLNGDVFSCYTNSYISNELNKQQQQLQNAGLNSQKYAIKVFKTATEFQSEADVLSKLDHPNVIKILNSNDNKMLMNYYQNGDLFDFLQKHGRQIMNEDIARFFFKQLLTAVQYIHSQNIVHRDIKLENILIDDEFNLILSDFGLSTLVDRGQQLDQYLGTQSYMAPEIVQKSKYFGQASDIFAMGVILFCVVVGTYPFQNKAIPADMHYKYFVNKSFLRYWLLVEKQCQVSLSPSFKSLINKMLSYDPNERITIEEIWDHEWLNGETCATAQDIKLAISKLQEQQQQQQPQQDEN